MTRLNWPVSGKVFKLLFLSLLLGACSTNAATGRSQFAALMSPEQERSVGASEHQKIAADFGFYENERVLSYVRQVGSRVVKDTERPDVTYQFYVLDSPIVNAFALPGGYIYVSRGLLALAGSEAELAAVLAHEAGHITARHSAERYSHGVVTSLGAALLSAAVDSGAASQALGLGADLYLKSYSRDQESEADTLGLRYMTRGGYAPQEMASFLQSLQGQSALDGRLEGKGGDSFSYFSTHPATADRVAKTRAEASQYGSAGAVERDSYLDAIDGLVYGDSAKQGFIRGKKFLHPDMGFGFEAPEGFRLINQPGQVIAASPSGAVMLFDFAVGRNADDPVRYLLGEWMKGENLPQAESVTVGGMPAATAAFEGQVGGRPATIRLMAIRWSEKKFARFQIAIPRGASPVMIDGIKTATYSLRRLGESEKTTLKPYRVRIVTAKAGDSPASLAARQPFTEMSEERFRVLNGLAPSEALEPGRRYKLVLE